MFKNIKNKVIENKTIIIISCIIAFIILIVFIISYKYRTNIKPSNIYVCDSKNKSSEFDNWIKDELDIIWVPTFIIIKDKKVVGLIYDNSNDGIVDINEFSYGINNVNGLSEKNITLPDYKITNISDQTNSLKDIVTTDDTYIIEVAWIDCPDCINQEKKNKAILARYTAKNFYIYYMNSTKDQVIEKYIKQYN